MAEKFKYVLENEKGKKINLYHTEKLPKKIFDELAWSASLQGWDTLGEIAAFLETFHGFKVEEEHKEVCVFVIQDNPTAEAKQFIKRNYYIQKIANLAEASWDETVGWLMRGKNEKLYRHLSQEQFEEMNQMIQCYHAVCHEIEQVK